MIYLGSDGLEDQNNKKRKKLGRKKLKSIVQDYHNLPLDKQKEIFEKTLDEHMQDEFQRDDILWMGLRL